MLSLVSRVCVISRGCVVTCQHGVCCQQGCVVTCQQGVCCHLLARGVSSAWCALSARGVCCHLSTASLSNVRSLFNKKNAYFCSNHRKN